MTNTLKNFLEQYHDNEIFSDDQLGEIQYVIIPKVLDLVEKEVRTLDTPQYPVENEKLIMLQDGAVIGFYDCRKDISTIINSLRVK